MRSFPRLCGPAEFEVKADGQKRGRAGRKSATTRCSPVLALVLMAGSGLYGHYFWAAPDLELVGRILIDVLIVMVSPFDASALHRWQLGAMLQCH